MMTFPHRYIVHKLSSTYPALQRDVFHVFFYQSIDDVRRKKTDKGSSNSFADIN